MERLTAFDGEFWVHKDFPPVGEDTIDEFVDCVKELAARLASIEDILGDEYDLDRLRKLVEADRNGRCHIGRCVECEHYEGLAVCEFLGDCGGTDWICGWFEPKKDAEAALKGEQHEKH